MYLSQLPSYRDAIVEEILKSDEITRLLLDANGVSSARELPYRYLFPYFHMLEKASDTGVYICFDINTPHVSNPSHLDHGVIFWIMCHERCIRTDKGLVTDLIQTELDKLINGSRDFGFESMKLVRGEFFKPADGFYGRTLEYKTTDFNRR